MQLDTTMYINKTANTCMWMYINKQPHECMHMSIDKNTNPYSIDHK